MHLTPAQRAALQHVRQRARHAGDPGLVAAIRRHGRVTLNFHPDRRRADGLTVAEALLGEGLYRSQFETGLTAGSRTAFAGGPRDLWEAHMFGGAYSGAADTERPRYGGLNLMRHPDGASPRFGSCHLRLRPEVLERCTFCFGDSYLQPEHLGTLDTLRDVLDALFRAVRETGVALGRPGLDEPALRQALVSPPAPSGQGRALDDYIEAQVHGNVRLAEDVEALVADPSYRGSPVVHALAERYGFALEWHPGYRLLARDVPAEFRGPAIPPLALRIAQEHGEPLTAAVLGRAAETLGDEAFQHLKQLWHVLVQYGQPHEG